jgi:hypothetical protein
MRELEDKRSRNAVLTQATAIYMGFVLERLFVQKGLGMADFPEVEHHPEIERSLQVGAPICASVNMIAGTMLPNYPEDTWVLYFWQKESRTSSLGFWSAESTTSTEHDFRDLVAAIESKIRQELRLRCEAYKPDMQFPEVFSAVTALLSRQATFGH